MVALVGEAEGGVADDGAVVAGVAVGEEGEEVWEAGRPDVREVDCLKSCGERDEEGEGEKLEAETHTDEAWLGLPVRGLCDRASFDRFNDMQEA